MRRSERRKEGRKEEEGLRLRVVRILCVIGGASLFNSIEAKRGRNARTGRVEARTNVAEKRGSEFTENETIDE